MKMKTIFSVLAAAATACTLSVSAFAGSINDSEKAILDYLNGVEIDGAKISADYINKASNYFMSDAVEVSVEAAKEFVADAEEVKAYCIANGIGADENGAISIDSLKGLSAEKKNEMLDGATALAEDLGLSLSYSPIAKEVKVYDAEGNVVDTITASTIGETGFGGYEYVLTASGVLLGLVAVSAVAAKKRKLTK